MCNKAQQVVHGLTEVTGNSITEPASQIHKSTTLIQDNKYRPDFFFPLISNKTAD